MFIGGNALARRRTTRTGEIPRAGIDGLFTDNTDVGILARSLAF
jgi:hypothetical protein